MSKNLLKYLVAIVLSIVCLLNCQSSFGQEYYDTQNSPRQYYYNDFTSATPATPSTYFQIGGSVRSTNATIGMKTSGITGNTLSSLALGAIGYLQWDFLQTTGAAGVNLGSNTWEWEFDYKNVTGAAPADATTTMPVSSGSTTDSWRYWLIASSYVSTNNTVGLFVTVNNGQLKLMTKYNAANTSVDNLNNAGITIPVGNNTDVYQIRIVKTTGGAYYIYVFDRTTPSTNKYGPINVGNTNSIDLNTYNYSFLESSTSTADRFQWDNFNFFQPRLNYIAISGSAHGITSAVYPGIVDAIPYGVNVDVRGDVTIGRFVALASANSQALFSGGALYKTTNSVLSKAGGTQLATCSVYNTGTSQMTLPTSEAYYSEGNTDGTTVNVVNYYLVLQGKNPFDSGYPTSLSWSVSTTTDDNYSNTYSTGGSPIAPTTAETAAPPALNGDVWDWTGALSSSWTSFTNWKKNTQGTISTPSASTDIVRIGVLAYSSLGKQPQLAGNISIASLEFGKLGSTSATATAPVILDMAGKTFTVSAGLTIDASATATLDNTTTTVSTFNVAGTSSMTSTSTLKFPTTNGVSISNTGTFTLLSDASGSATIGPLSATSLFTGNVNVQRYMSGGVGRRGYRLLSSPVFTTTFGTPTAVRAYTVYYLQATTPITGWGTGTYHFTQPSPAAFDNTAVGNPSALFYYEPDADPASRVIANSDYKGLNTISDALPIGNGFLFFFRGNRNLLAANGVSKVSTTAVPENTELSYTGVLNQGDVKVYIPTAPLITYSGNTKVYSQATANNNLSTTFSNTAHTPASSSDGFHLIGNPYAATIDLDKLTSPTSPPFTNPVNLYAYALTNSGAFGSYLIGSAGATYVGSVSRYISQGQGFFVRGSSTSTLTFNEGMKVTTGYSAPTTAFSVSTDSVAPMQVLHVMLALDSNNNNETLIQFGYNKASNKYSDKEDAGYMTGPTQTTYLTSYSSDNKPCLINQMSTLDSVKSIVLYAEGPTTGKYTFTFSGAQSLDPRYKLYLKDNLLKDSLDLSTNTTYAFNIDRANTQTYGDKRFSIVVYPTHIADLYQLTTFKGIKNNNSVTLNWKTVYEGNYTGFKVQRSVDGGKTFVTIGDLQSDGSGNYSFTDTNPMLDAANQYKIAQNNINNVNSFSDVITISYLTVDTKTNKLQIFPNPVASIINVAIKTDKNSGPLVVKVFSVMGELMMTSTFTQNSSLSMDVGNLMKGAYVIQVSDNNKNYGSATFTKL